MQQTTLRHLPLFSDSNTSLMAGVHPNNPETRCTMAADQRRFSDYPISNRKRWERGRVSFHDSESLHSVAGKEENSPPDFQLLTDGSGKEKLPSGGKLGCFSDGNEDGVGGLLANRSRYISPLRDTASLAQRRDSTYPSETLFGLGGYQDLTENWSEKTEERSVTGGSRRASNTPSHAFHQPRRFTTAVTRATMSDRVYQARAGSVAFPNVISRPSAHLGSAGRASTSFSDALSDNGMHVASFWGSGQMDTASFSELGAYEPRDSFLDVSKTLFRRYSENRVAAERLRDEVNRYLQQLGGGTNGFGTNEFFARSSESARLGVVSNLSKGLSGCFENVEVTQNDIERRRATDHCLRSRDVSLLGASLLDVQLCNRPLNSGDFNVRGLITGDTQARSRCIAQDGIGAHNAIQGDAGVRAGSQVGLDEKHREDKGASVQESDVVAFKGPAFKSDLTPEEIASIPKDEAGELTSIGSLAHASGNCRPCAFMNNPKRERCTNGINCCFCHFPHEKKKKATRPSKHHRLLKRAQKQMERDAAAFLFADTKNAGHGMDGGALSKEVLSGPQLMSNQFGTKSSGSLGMIDLNYLQQFNVRPEHLASMRTGEFYDATEPFEQQMRMWKERPPSASFLQAEQHSGGLRPTHSLPLRYLASDRSSGTQCLSPTLSRVSKEMNSDCSKNTHTSRNCTNSYQKGPSIFLNRVDPGNSEDDTQARNEAQQEPGSVSSTSLSPKQLGDGMVNDSSGNTQNEASYKDIALKRMNGLSTCLTKQQDTNPDLTRSSNACYNEGLPATGGASSSTAAGAGPTSNVGSDVQSNAAMSGGVWICPSPAIHQQASSELPPHPSSSLVSPVLYVLSDGSWASAPQGNTPVYLDSPGCLVPLRTENKQVQRYVNGYGFSDHGALPGQMTPPYPSGSTPYAVKNGSLWRPLPMYSVPQSSSLPTSEVASYPLFPQSNSRFHPVPFEREFSPSSSTAPHLLPSASAQTVHHGSVVKSAGRNEMMGGFLGSPGAYPSLVGSEGSGIRLPPSQSTMMPLRQGHANHLRVSGAPGEAIFAQSQKIVDPKQQRGKDHHHRGAEHCARSNNKL